MNRVRLYSNGTGLFERAYRIAPGQTLDVSLPIRNVSLDETVASLGVFGEVTLIRPPSYTPIGTGRRTLDLEANRIVRSLAMRLRGARVALRLGGQTVAGRLLGVEDYTERVEGGSIGRYRIAFLDDAGELRAVAETEVQSLRFEQAEVQAEVEQALQRAYETVTPDSTAVNLTLAAEGAETAEARVQYAVANLGAWKLSYRLRAAGGKWELDAHAVVDNNTDEPWEDFLISVVTGQPVSFETDLAEVRTVERSRVNMVADQALEAFTPEEAVPMGKYLTGPNLEEMPPAGAAYALELEAPASRARAARMQSRGVAFEAALSAQKAQQPQAEARQVAASVEYTAPAPVSVGANRSALIPLFDAALEDGRTLLLYRRDRHDRHPFRAVRFRNRTGYPLGRGVCTLFEDGSYAGKAVLEDTPVGEGRTLPYALEGGVRVYREDQPHRTRRARIEITKGVVAYDETERTVTLYRVASNTDTPFRLEVEHPARLHKTGLKVTRRPEAESPEVVEIEGGARVGVDLPARTELTLQIEETRTHGQSIRLSGTQGAQWLIQNLLTADHPLATDPGVQECVQRNRELAYRQGEVQRAEKRVQEIEKEQERLIKLLKAGGREASVAEWQDALPESERRIKETNEVTLPRLREEVTAAEAALEEALQRLAVSWGGGEA